RLHVGVVEGRAHLADDAPLAPGELRGQLHEVFPLGGDVFLLDAFAIQDLGVEVHQVGDVVDGVVVDAARVGVAVVGRAVLLVPVRKVFGERRQIAGAQHVELPDLVYLRKVGAGLGG